MKCIYHPDKDAIVQCSRCRSPLCEQCAIPEGNESFICRRCAALKAGQDAHEASKDACEEINQHLEEKEYKRQIEEAKKKRLPYLMRLALISLAVGIIIVNLFLYFGSSIPELKEFTASEQPVVTAIIIDEAIRDYAEDHGGNFPQRLDELLGKYISPDVVMPKDLEDFHYRRISPNSYELWPEKIDDDMIQDLVFTEERPEP